jgi:hypothetical protein
VLRILEGADECENFKVYSQALKSLFEDNTVWKRFTEVHPEDLYSQEGTFIFPASKFDSKPLNLTYSELSNLLYISRPYELKRYLLNSPESAHYNLGWRSTWQHVPKSAKTILCFSGGQGDSFEAPIIGTAEKLIHYGFVSNQTDIVHLLQIPKLNELEKHLYEGKTMIVYSLHSWPTDMKSWIFSQLSKKASTYALGYKTGTNHPQVGFQGGQDSFTSMNSLANQNYKNSSTLQGGYLQNLGMLTSATHQTGKTALSSRLVVICDNMNCSSQFSDSLATLLSDQEARVNELSLPSGIQYNLFDAVINLDMEMSIKQTSVDLAKSILQVPLKATLSATLLYPDLIDLCEKVNYDYANEMKAVKIRTMAADTVVPIFKSLISPAAFKSPSSHTRNPSTGLFVSNVVESLTTLSALKVQRSLDENRALLVTLLLFGISLQQQRFSARYKGTQICLRLDDLHQLWKTLFTTLRCQGDHSNAAYVSSLELLFPGFASSNILVSPTTAPFDSNYLLANFTKYFSDVYEGTSTNVKIGNYCFEIPLGSVRLNSVELLAAIHKFPNMEIHASSCWTTTRDFRYVDRQESWDLYRDLSWLWERGVLKQNVSVSGVNNPSGVDDFLNIAKERIASGNHLPLSISEDSPSSKQGMKVKDAQPDPNRSSQRSQAIYWMEMRSIMLNHLTILEGAITEPSLLAYPLITHLLSKRTSRELGKEDLDSPEPLLRNQQHKNSKARMTLKGAAPDARKSLLENFRAHMKKRFSSHNRASLFRTIETGGLNNRGSGTLIRKSNRVSMFKKHVSRILDQQEPSIPRKQSNLTGVMHASTRQVFIMDRQTRSINPRFMMRLYQQLALKPIYSKTAPAPVLRRTHIGQSQLWIEARAVLHIESLMREVCGFKSSVISGEIGCMFGQYENHILKISSFNRAASTRYSQNLEEIRHKNWREDIVARSFNNQCPILPRTLVPVDLKSVDLNSTFGCLWLSVIQRKLYVEQLAKTDEGFPATGSYDLSKLFSPASLILNLGILYSIKMKVECFGSPRNPWNKSPFTACISQTSR